MRPHPEKFPKAGGKVCVRIPESLSRQRQSRGTARCNAGNISSETGKAGTGSIRTFAAQNEKR